MPLTYGKLDIKNPEYHFKTWVELEDLYRGGYPLDAKKRQYLPRYRNEPMDKYSERLEMSSYINHLGQVVDQFVAQLFSKELFVQPAADKDDPNTIGGGEKLPDRMYEVFMADADRRGTSFEKLMREVTTTAFLKRKAIVAVDFPSRDQITESPSTRADEEKLGVDRAYAYMVPVESLIDWEYGDNGDFKWLVIKKTLVSRDTLDDDRDEVQDEFRYWHTVDGKVICDVYRSDMRKIDQDPKPTDPVSHVDSIETKFKRPPFVELMLPEGLWAGSRIGLLAKEHWQRRSSLIASENKSLYAIPFVTLGPEMTATGDALPSEVQQNPSRGKDPVAQFRSLGALVLGKDDNVRFAEPSGAAYELIDKQLSDLIDEMHRVVHQMATGIHQTQQSVYRSAASKIQDRSTTEIVLSAYGSYVKDAARKVYRIISESRDEDIVWQAMGLDKYDLTDRNTLINEAQLMGLQNIPSKTWRKVYLTRMALAFTGDTTAETQKTIKDEIEKSVDEQGDTIDMMNNLPRKIAQDPAKAQEVLTPPIASGGKPQPKPNKFVQGAGGKMMGST